MLHQYGTLGVVLVSPNMVGPGDGAGTDALPLSSFVIGDYSNKKEQAVQAVHSPIILECKHAACQVQRRDLPPAFASCVKQCAVKPLSLGGVNVMELLPCSAPTIEDSALATQYQSRLASSGLLLLCRWRVGRIWSQWSRFVSTGIAPLARASEAWLKVMTCSVLLFGATVWRVRRSRL